MTSPPCHFDDFGFMQVIVRVAANNDVERIKRFLSMFQFKELSIVQNGVSLSHASEESENLKPYYLRVVPNRTGLVEEDIQVLLEETADSILFFNESLPEIAEPKVIYTTDHSERANMNLEKFKLLKPRGFAGAVVVSDGEFMKLENSFHEIARQILEHIKFTVRSARANLIIANFDFADRDHRISIKSNLAKIILQNKCHVLVLKA